MASAVSPFSAPAVAWVTTIGDGQALTRGHTLWASNRSQRASITQSGKLLILSGSRVLWTAPGVGTSLALTTSGDVRFTRGSTLVWTSRTTAARTRLVVANTALLLYQGRRLVWTSHPAPPRPRPVTTTTYHTTPTTTRPPTTTIPSVPVP
jgi:hypothetical protein